MSDVINLDLFLEYFSYYLKMVIYINKSTYEESYLDFLIKLHNKIHKIHVKKLEDEYSLKIVKKCLKDIHQLSTIISLFENSKGKNPIAEILDHMKNNKIFIIPKILPGWFLHGVYSDIVWQYTRCLYYFSKILLYPEQTKKNMKVLEIIIGDIASYEGMEKLQKLMEEDQYMTENLVNLDNISTVHEASNKVKSMFFQNGENPQLDKIINSVTQQLSGYDMTPASILPNIANIIKNVSAEIREDVEKNPEQMQNTFQSVKGVLESFNTSESGFDIKKLMSSARLDQEEIEKSEFLGKIENFLKKNDNGKQLLEETIDIDGQIDFKKLQDLIEKS